MAAKSRIAPCVGNANEIWEVDTTNRQERLLLASVGWRPSLPRWSSDGRYIAYTRSHSSESDASVARAITVLSASEGRERLVALPRGADMTPTDWSEDGSTILGYCHSDPKQPMSVCSMRVDNEIASAPKLRTIASDARMNLWVPRFRQTSGGLRFSLLTSWTLQRRVSSSLAPAVVRGFRLPTASPSKTNHDGLLTGKRFTLFPVVAVR